MQECTLPSGSETAKILTKSAQRGSFIKLHEIQSAFIYTKKARNVVIINDDISPAAKVVITPSACLPDFSAATNLDMDVCIGAMLNEKTMPYMGKIN